MKCPYCKTELEQGYVYISATGNLPCFIIEWFSNQKELNTFLGIRKRKKVNIKDKHNGKFPNFFYCTNCKKVYGEFEV